MVALKRIAQHQEGLGLFWLYDDMSSGVIMNCS